MFQIDSVTDCCKQIRATVPIVWNSCLCGFLLILILSTISQAKQAEHICSRSDQIRTAIAELTKRVQKDPKDYAAQYRRAICYGQLHEYQNAIADFSKAIKVNPCNAASKKEQANNKNVALLYLALSYQNRGLTYLRMDQYQKGIDDIGKAISLRPQYAPNYQTRAMFLEKLGDVAGAKRDYEQYNALVYSKQQGIRHVVK
jgi:Tfp pilus assembly protein PilF